MSAQSSDTPLFDLAEVSEPSLYDRIKAGLIRVHHYSPPEWRFWAQVDKNGPVHPVCGQCWVWTGSVTEDGYGKLKISGRRYWTHRFSWHIHYEEIPNGLWVLHKCDRRRCVNPSHLFLGSTQDNTSDMVNKGRQAKGEQHTISKLTLAQVAEIRKRYKPRSKTDGTRALGREFGVSNTTISQVIREKTWKCGAG
jgi:hypothetical protein